MYTYLCLCYVHVCNSDVFVFQISETVVKLEDHIQNSQEASVDLLTTTSQPTRLDMNQLLGSVGLSPIQPSPEEEEVVKWGPNSKRKRRNTKTYTKAQRRDGNSREQDDSTFEKRVRQS